MMKNQDLAMVAMDSGGAGNNNHSSSSRVCYWCIWKEGQVVYKNGNHEMDSMAALCLELIPPYHTRYFETIPPYTFAFLMDHRHRHRHRHALVYFAILRHSPGNSHLLTFLHNLRDQFNKIGSLDQDRFLPAVRRLVASLDRVSEATVWPAVNGDAEAAATSTKAPLLARPCKQDKKKIKLVDADGVRDIETADHRRRSSDAQGTPPPSSSTSQNQRQKWCRQVRIVLAIDAAVCILLFIIWLVICRGIQCIR